MGGACSTNGANRNAYRILVGKPEGQRPLGRPRRRWVDNIEMYLREIGWDGVDWIDRAQDRDQWRASNCKAQISANVFSLWSLYFMTCRALSTGMSGRRLMISS
jgi:hypothetical protein